VTLREGQPARPDALDPPRVALVAGRPITVARLEQRIAEVRRGPRGRHLLPEGGSESVRLGRSIVQELVTEEVLAHEARAAGMPGFSQSAIANLVERVTDSATVPPRDVRAYYVRNPDLYRRREARRVRHILLPDEASAHEVVRRLAAGDDMAGLATAVSIDAGSRTAGGDLGDVHRGELTGPLEDAIFAARIGAVLGPIESEHGWHVVRVDGVVAASTVPFAEARPAIEAELLDAERTRMFAAWLEARRTELSVIEPGFEHPAHPVHGFPSHRH
jgi:hypothetical protein